MSLTPVIHARILAKKILREVDTLANKEDRYELLKSLAGRIKQEMDMFMVCPECDRAINSEEMSSTYCGSMHEKCFSKHIDHCEICRGEA